jgi:hypothetical protein
MTMMRMRFSRSCRLLCFGLAGLGLALPAQEAAPPATASASEPARQVPVIDGGVGPCSLEVTVTTVDGKPVYAAKVKVHIAYGFGGFHRLDLEAGTNSDGKLKFTGLPSKVHYPPLEFQASKDTWTGTAAYNPVTECQAKHDIILDKPKSTESK